MLCMCCRSNQTLGQFVSKPGQFVLIFLFCFCFAFAANKKFFWHLRSSLHFHSTYLTYHSLSIPCSPNIPIPLFFYLIAYLVSPKPQTFGFSNEPWRLFFNYMYIEVVINFLKLFKSDIYVGPSPSQS